MTPADFRSALQRLGLSQTGASRILGVADRTIRSWLTGERSVPEPVAKLMRLMASGAVSKEVVEAA